jgi:hypothetical protein
MGRGSRGGARPPGAQAVRTGRGLEVFRLFERFARGTGRDARAHSSRRCGAGESPRPPPTGLEVRSHLRGTRWGAAAEVGRDLRARRRCGRAAAWRFPAFSSGLRAGRGVTLGRTAAGGTGLVRVRARRLPAWKSGPTSAAPDGARQPRWGATSGRAGGAGVPRPGGPPPRAICPRGTGRDARAHRSRRYGAGRESAPAAYRPGSPVPPRRRFAPDQGAAARWGATSGRAGGEDGPRPGDFPPFRAVCARDGA